MAYFDIPHQTPMLRKSVSQFQTIQYPNIPCLWHDIPYPHFSFQYPPIFKWYPNIPIWLVGWLVQPSVAFLSSCRHRWRQTSFPDDNHDIPDDGLFLLSMPVFKFSKSDKGQGRYDQKCHRGQTYIFWNFLKFFNPLSWGFIPVHESTENLWITHFWESQRGVLAPCSLLIFAHSLCFLLNFLIAPSLYEKGAVKIGKIVQVKNSDFLPNLAGRY